MVKYVIKRVLQIIPVLLCVAILIFTIMYFAEGDPIFLILGDSYTPEQYAEVAARYGLDKGYFGQLWDFLKNLFLNLDFGTSYILKTDVRTELFARLPRTAIIAAVCCALQIVISIPLGIVAATHQNGILDRICTVFAMLCISMPGFWVGMMLLLVFAHYLHLLPVSGIDHWYSYILPCIACALQGVGSMTRMTRSQMLEVIRSDYVVTARAKGVPERTILYQHALPNALIPIITFIGTHFGRALGGTVVIETVFGVPGIGLYMVQAVGNRDYPIIRGGVTLLSLLFCLVILVVDVLYAFIDPRIKAQYEGGGKHRSKPKKQARRAAANG